MKMFKAGRCRGHHGRTGFGHRRGRTEARASRACAAPVPPPPPLVDPAAIDSALKSLIDSKKIVGVSALVYERGKEVYFGAFGLADRENNKPMARDTIVQIFSMTKPVTGVALMQLYERGKFDLDAPLAVYAPEFAEVRVYAGLDASGQPKYEAPKRPITVRDILRHTAGFHGDGSPEAVTAIYRQIDPRNLDNALPEVSARLAKVPLSYQPGTQWKYSDVVDVQAYLVQKISGVPFDEFLKLHILRPLGMTTHALHHPAHRPGSPAARGDLHAQRGRHVHAPDGRRGLPVQQRRLAATSPAASASSPRSTTT